MRTHRGSGLPHVLAHPLLGAVRVRRPAGASGAARTDAPTDGAMLVLRRGGHSVVLGRADRGDRCGLGFVDDLLRLQLALGRLGWELHLGQVAGDVAELLDLVGLPVVPSRPGSP